MLEAELHDHIKSILRGSRSLKKLVLLEPNDSLRLDLLEALYEQTWAHMGSYVEIAKDEGLPTKQREAAELVARVLEEIATDIDRERTGLLPKV